MLVSFWTRYPKKSVKKESFDFEFSSECLLLEVEVVYTILKLIV